MLVRRLLAPPVFADEEKTHIARLLHWITLVVILLALVYLVTLVTLAFLPLGILYTAAVVGIALAVNTANRRGHIKAAGLAFAVMLWIVLSLPMLSARGGVHHPSFSAYIVPILIGSLMVSGQAGIMLALISALSGLGRLLLIDDVDLFDGENTELVLNWIAQSVAFLAAASLVALTMRSMKDALLRASQSERTLAARNRELQDEIIGREKAQTALQTSEESARRFQESLKALQEVSIALSTLDTEEELFRRAIELGRSRLGFDRLGLFLLDDAHKEALGTFGTDAQGNLRDERHFRRALAEDTHVTEVLANKTLLNYWENTPLYDSWEIVGHGWNAMAVLWDGDKSIGWLACDNLINHQPLAQYQLELLTLYGVTLGHLTRQQRTADALRDSEQRLNLALQAARMRIWRWDLQTDMVTWSTWSNADEFVVEPLSNFVERIHPPDRHILVESRNRLLKEREDFYQTEFRVTRRDGRIRWLASLGQVYDDEQGTPVLITGVSFDVTARKEAELALQFSEERFSKAFHANPSALSIATLDDGRYVDVNSTWEKLLGYSRDEAVGRTSSELNIWLEPESRTQLVTTLRQQGFIHNLPIEARTKVGTNFNGLMSIEMIELDGTAYALSMTQDTSERTRAEQQRQELLLAKERLTLLTEFIDKISHDLKTPLSIINTCLYLIENLTDPVEQQASLQQIKDQTRLLESYIQDILTISRLDHMASLSMEAVDLNDLLTRVVRRLRPAADKKQLALNLDLADKGLAVLGDESELDRMAVNLIENAFTYTPERGQVHVRTYPYEGRFVFEVTDSGIGIPENDLPHIFDRFYRSTSARQFERRGTGLGLTIVKKIVDMHHAQIDVKSVAGAGSTFSVVLPLAEKSAWS